MWFVRSENGVDFVFDIGHNMEKIIQELAEDFPACIYFEADLCAPEESEPIGRIPRHMFDQVPDVTFDSRLKCEDVLEHLQGVIDNYGSVTVADYRTMCNLSVEHQNYKWGWKNLDGAVIRQHQNKFILDLPLVERL